MDSHSLITTPEACEITGLKKRTLLRRVATGDLPYVRRLEGRNGRFLYDRAVVELYARQLDREREKVA